LLRTLVSFVALVFIASATVGCPPDDKGHDHEHGHDHDHDHDHDKKK
jgi:ABC-type nickel/cobalt efflux system permease component RcnA